MDRRDQYKDSLLAYPLEDKSESQYSRLKPIVDEKIGIDLWISSSIKGKRREILKQQMTSHLSRMKTLQFNYQA